ncbi:MAG: citramalate synthase [Firmicutes bacterium]|jgi:2-isopropylmalate synthase|nr:citramalate synthase [Bacillota bacterium]
MKSIVLYDTTLRDGTQRAAISLSLDDKLQIAALLDEFGMDYIEGGFPGSNPKDAQFFEWMRQHPKVSKMAAFGSTVRKGMEAKDDPNLRALVDAQSGVATIFGKASAFHAEKVLGVDRAENLRMVESSIRFLVGEGLEVLFDAEHFFDGCREDQDYAMEVLKRAQDGGAAWVVLCDTNGGSLPHHVGEMVSRAAEAVQVRIGIHAHDDSGLGVANSLEAVLAGAEMVQGTINGYGERCGNANLCTVIPDLVLKMGYDLNCAPALDNLTRLSRTVADIANLSLDAAAPFVGENAFTHKAGLHVGAVRKHPHAYEHVKPESVGQTRRVLMSELAGRANLLYQFDGLNLEPQALTNLMDDVKRLEAQGYQFEAAESSVALMVQRAMGQVPSFYHVDRFHVSVAMDGVPVTEATVRLTVGQQTVLEVGDGDGPVNALDNALRRALTRFYPVIGDLRLTDYKVRVLDANEATAATVRVHVRSEFHGEPVTTVGVSPNILEASWKALLDAVDYALWRDQSQHSADPGLPPSEM